ncbi:MFS transporter [Psychromonas algicola]|uniref:MFS transporter n=1 Tax=Psychromonas algicola TaxID=2555642 RepID=UPI001067276B|nr:MFS transporter [Psychromonas sp. RZ5]TEW52449.1 MFS transporter [Psychromonas sp. RZ5]
MKKLTHYNRLVLAVCLSSIVTFSNIYWLHPLLPTLQQEFKISLLAANLAMSAPLLGMGLGLLIFASVSDSIGRRSILVKGMIAGLCVSLLLPLVENYTLFLSLRFIQGALLSACPAIAIPLLGEELRKSWLPAAVGFYIASNSIGGISSRLIGGTFVELLGSWQATGLLIAVITSVLFLVVYLIVPKQRHFTAQKFKIMPSLNMFIKHLQRPQLVIIYMVIGLAFGCFVNLFSYLMTVLEGAPYQLPSGIRSLIFITFLGGTTSASLAGKFSKKHGQLAGVATGVFIMLAANILLSNQHLSMMIIGMIMMAFGFFFCHAQASTLVGRTVKKGRGSAQALYSLFYYTGASLGVFFVAPFYENWGWQGVIASTSIALIVCLGLLAIYQVKFTLHHKHVTPSI